MKIFVAVTSICLYYIEGLRSTCSKWLHKFEIKVNVVNIARSLSARIKTGTQHMLKTTTDSSRTRAFRFLP